MKRLRSFNYFQATTVTFILLLSASCIATDLELSTKSLKSAASHLILTTKASKSASSLVLLHKETESPKGSKSKKEAGTQSSKSDKYTKGGKNPKSGKDSKSDKKSKKGKHVNCVYENGSKKLVESEYSMKKSAKGSDSSSKSVKPGKDGYRRKLKKSKNTMLDTACTEEEQKFEEEEDSEGGNAVVVSSYKEYRRTTKKHSKGSAYLLVYYEEYYTESEMTIHMSDTASSSMGKKAKGHGDRRTLQDRAQDILFSNRVLEDLAEDYFDGVEAVIATALKGYYCPNDRVNSGDACSIVELSFDVYVNETVSVDPSEIDVNSTDIEVIVIERSNSTDVNNNSSSTSVSGNGTRSNSEGLQESTFKNESIADFVLSDQVENTASEEIEVEPNIDSVEPNFPETVLVVTESGSFNPETVTEVVELVSSNPETIAEGVESVSSFPVTVPEVVEAGASNSSELDASNSGIGDTSDSEVEIEKDFNDDMRKDPGNSEVTLFFTDDESRRLEDEDGAVSIALIAIADGANDGDFLEGNPSITKVEYLGNSFGALSGFKQQGVTERAVNGPSRNWIVWMVVGIAVVAILLLSCVTFRRARRMNDQDEKSLRRNYFDDHELDLDATLNDMDDDYTMSTDQSKPYLVEVDAEIVHDENNFSPADPYNLAKKSSGVDVHKCTSSTCDLCGNNSGVKFIKGIPSSRRSVTSETRDTVDL